MTDKKGKLESNFIIRDAKSEKEVEDLWWPFMQKFLWNRSKNDVRTHYHSAGQSAWHIAVQKDSDAPVGCVVSFVYPNSSGWIGFFCVDESFRGQGLGGKLFATSLAYFKSKGTQLVGLDGVEEQVPTYGRRGFVETDLTAVYIRPDTNNVPEAERPLTDSIGPVVALGVEDQKLLIASDLSHSGLLRERVWTVEAMWSRDDVRFFAIKSLDHEDKGTERELKAWTLLRSCEHGYRIGPVYAQNTALASQVLRAAMKHVEGRPGTLVAEVWSSNKKARGLFDDFGWESQNIEYHRMWLNGNAPEAQRKGGKAENECFAVFDAGEG